MEIIKQTIYSMLIIILLIFLSNCTYPSLEKSSSQIVSSETVLSSAQTETQVETTILNTSDELVDNAKKLPYYKSYTQEHDIEELLNANPIDACYLQDNSQMSTAQIVEFYGKYCEYWEAEMNNVLEIIQESVSAECWQTVKDSQSDWENYICEDVGLFSSVYYEIMGNGSAVSIYNAKKALLETRYRTLELVECCMMICGEYEFIFIKEGAL